jgi:4'-phosphopantetheinyl transferase
MLLPAERAWAEGLPEPARWRALLSLWTAKEAVLKALGQGFCFGLDQVELGPDRQGGIALQRLCGSEGLAQGWRIEHEERHVGNRIYLVAVARLPSTLSE